MKKKIVKTSLIFPPVISSKVMVRTQLVNVAMRTILTMLNLKLRMVV